MDPKPLVGVDTRVGDLTTPSKSISSIIAHSIPGVKYYAGSNELHVTQPGVVLDGYNFGNTTVMVEANHVTIKNSTFSAGGKELWCVRAIPGVSGTIIANAGPLLSSTHVATTASMALAQVIVQGRLRISATFHQAVVKNDVGSEMTRLVAGNSPAI
jgi:hypothetical protein